MGQFWKPREAKLPFDMPIDQRKQCFDFKMILQRKIISSGLLVACWLLLFYKIMYSHDTRAVTIIGDIQSDLHPKNYEM